MNDKEITLKEILIQVSEKLDRFLEAHAALHTDIAANEAKVDAVIASRENWGNRIDAIERWQDKADGQLSLLKWAAGGGLLGAIALILRLVGIPTP